MGASIWTPNNISLAAMSVFSGIVNAVVNYTVPNDGTSASANIQAMIDDIAVNCPWVTGIYFPSGDYLLTCPASEPAGQSYASAVIWRGLRNIKVYGSYGTRFIQDSSGAGAPEFAMGRIEQCQNLEFFGFELDGSGINIYTNGGARSQAFYIANYDVFTNIDFAISNYGIHFHHIYAHHLGGFVSSATRNEASLYPLKTYGVSIHDIWGGEFVGQNHFVGMTYTDNVHVYNCTIRNTLVATASIGNAFADMSAGVVNALIENNYAYGFPFGMKAESHINCGPALNEDRPSENVRFLNNKLEEIGDPVTTVYPGPTGGGTYGIRLHGINHKAEQNTIIGRTLTVSTGRLYQGVQVAHTLTNTDTEHTIRDNHISKTVVGVTTDTPLDTTRRCNSVVEYNKIRDTLSVASAVNDGCGIIAGRNTVVRYNKLHRTLHCAVWIQDTDNTIVESNDTYDCSSTNLAAAGAPVVFHQDGVGAQGYFAFINNNIFDTRGGAAAAYGYHFDAGVTYTNKYRFVPGVTNTLLTAIAFARYINEIGQSLQLSGILTPTQREIMATGSPQATAPWNAIAWKVNDRAINQVPTVGQPKAWICITQGTPGVWQSEGLL